MTSAAPTSRRYPDVESSTDAYARRFSGPVGAWFLQVQWQAVRRLLHDVPPGTPVLDVGGGHAQLVPHLVAAGFKPTVVGSDARCAMRLDPWLADGRCRFEVGDLLALPFEPAAFPVVISIRVLSHIDPWARFVAELCRVAGHVVIVDYASRRSVNVWAERLFVIKQRVEGDTRPYRVFDPTEIEAAFRDQGFRVAGRAPQFLFPMAFHRWLGRPGASRVLEKGAAVTGLHRRLGSPVLLKAERFGRLGQPVARGPEPPHRQGAAASGHSSRR